MTVRNFFSRVKVDGRSTVTSFGPGAKTGGFTQTIYMRHNGQVVEALSICAEAIGDELRLYVEPADESLKVRPYTMNHRKGFRIFTTR